MNNRLADPHVTGLDCLNRIAFVSVSGSRSRGVIDEEVWLAE